jgi:Phage integrase family
VFTGARHGELQRVRREHVDLQGLLNLPGTKTARAYRQLPLAEHPPLLALMTSVLESHFDLLASILAPWSNIRRDLHAACGRAGIPRVSPNDLRRTFGTWLRLGGMSTDRIAVLFGHTDARMMERVYGQLDPAAMGAAIHAIFSSISLAQLSSAGSYRVTDEEQNPGLLGHMTHIPSKQSRGTSSAQGRNRTSDTRIFSPLLYQLSYLGKWGTFLGLGGRRVKEFPRVRPLW